MVVNTEICVLEVRLLDGHLSVRTPEIIGLGDQITLHSALPQLLEELLDQCSKGINHVKVQLVVENTRIVDSADAEIIYKEVIFITIRSHYFTFRSYRIVSAGPPQCSIKFRMPFFPLLKGVVTETIRHRSVSSPDTADADIKT